MNAIHQARTAYATAVAPIRTGRDIEYDAFARITAQLSAAADGKTSFADMVETLHRNRRLWALLAGAVADDANALEPSLRARIFYLAEFTRHHTGRVLKGDADPQILVEINSAVMAGLRQETS